MSSNVLEVKQNTMPFQKRADSYKKISNHIKNRFWNDTASLCFNKLQSKKRLS